MHRDHAQRELQLYPGDRLIAYTEGITEAVDQQGAEWEEAGLLATLAASPTASADETVAQVRRALDAFTTGANQVDDMTLVVLRRQ